MTSTYLNRMMHTDLSAACDTAASFSCAFSRPACANFALFLVDTMIVVSTFVILAIGSLGGALSLSILAGSLICRAIVRRHNYIRE